MSDVIWEQIKFSWKDSNNITIIILDNIENEDFLDKIKAGWFPWVQNTWWEILINDI